MQHVLINNKFLLIEHKFTLDLHLKQPGLYIVLVDHLLNIEKEFENLDEQVI